METKNIAQEKKISLLKKRGPASDIKEIEDEAS